MTTCNICNVPMKVLLTSWYCPNDCDRKPKEQVTSYQVVERSDGKLWRVAAIRDGELVPKWASVVCWVKDTDCPPVYVREAVRYLDDKYGSEWGFTVMNNEIPITDVCKGGWLLVLGVDA